jgi:ERCC4-type nuclease
MENSARRSKAQGSKQRTGRADQSPKEALISVDPRAGSGKYLPKLGVLAESCTLKAGDFAWDGKSGGKKVPVGVELKTVPDAIACMRSGRFATNQAPEMLRIFDVRYFIVQGVYRNGPQGWIEIMKWGKWYPSIPSVPYIALRHWLTSIRFLGFQVVELGYERDVVDWLLAEFSWWQKDEHTSLRQADFGGGALVGVEPPRVRNSWARKMLRAVPMLGWGRSRAAAQHFGCIKTAVNASVDEWCAVEGIGKGLANQIVAGFEQDTINS